MPKTDEPLVTIRDLTERNKNIGVSKMADGYGLDSLTDRSGHDENHLLEAQNYHLVQQEKSLILNLNKKREDLHRLEEHIRITEKSIEEIVRLLNETRRKMFEQNNLETSAIELGKRKAQRTYSDPLTPLCADARCTSFSAPPSFTPPEKMNKIEATAINLSTTDREVKVQEAIDFAEQRRHSHSSEICAVPPQRMVQPTAIIQPRLTGQQAEINERMLQEVNMIRQHWQRIPNRLLAPPAQRPTAQTFPIPATLPYPSPNQNLNPVSGGGTGVSGSNSSSKARCEHCKSNANFLCSGCHQVWYCSKPCQYSSWEVHSQYCVRQVPFKT